MALRMLSDSTRLALTQHAVGVVTVNGTIGNKPHAFLLDTTLPGVVYRCDCNKINNYCDAFNDTATDRKDACPKYCDSSFSVDLLETGSVYVDGVESSLAFEGFSVPKFRAGRVCDYYSSDLFDYDYDSIADSVLGLGPKEFPSSSSVTKELDPLPWSKYSIFLTESPKESGSFLLAGGADAELVKQRGLSEVKLTAKASTQSYKASGWSLRMDDFLGEDVPFKNAYCSSGGCDVTISASSPVIQLKDSVWKDLKDVIPWKRYGCSTGSFGAEYVYICDADVELPRLGFTFGTQTLYLDKKHYTLPAPDSKGKIAVLLQTKSKSDANDWILGTPFLRAFHTSFDRDAKTVSFYCKQGVDCVENVKPKPNEWTENVDTTADSVKNFRKVAFVWSGIMSVLIALLVAAFLFRQKLRAQANVLLSKESDDKQDEQYTQVATPSTADDTTAQDKKRDSVFV